MDKLTLSQNHEVESSVEKMEAMFRKAESDLEYMSRKSNADIRQELGDNEELSPSELSRRLHLVKTEYTTLVQEVEEIKKAQMEMSNHMQQQLQVACQSLQALQLNTGAETSDASAEKDMVENLLGMKFPAYGSGDTEGTNHDRDSTDKSKSDQGNSPSSSCSSSANNSPRQDSVEEFSPSPAELRISSKDFIPVTEEEFQTVSELVRGRSKLEDVNRVYRKLHEYFLTRKNRDVLSVQEMTKMGMKITGATGQAKLKVLRSLKIVSIARSGSVKLI